jgi:D-3-phosphoglycerate dehydrogenase / 2-oxoglutarate reductase
MKSVYLEIDAWQPYLGSIFDGIAGVTVGKAGDDHEAAARAVRANALMLTNIWTISGDVLDRLPDVEVLARPGIGYENIDVPAASGRGVAVVYTPDGPTESTAELTVTLLLALARKLRQADQFARACRFGPPAELKATEVAGKTIGIIGLGRIGGRVAEICKALRMDVVAFDPYISEARAVALGVRRADSLQAMLPQADFVSVNAPVTPGTRKLINAETLSWFKPGACLINCARGALIDEPALVQALGSGQLAAAGLDVYDPEPPRPENPLLGLENLILTPHLGAFTVEATRSMAIGAAEQIVDVFAGRRPANLLNSEVWDRPNLRPRRLA